MSRKFDDLTAQIADLSRQLRQTDEMRGSLGEVIDRRVKALRQQADELECLRNTLPNMIPNPAEAALRRLLQP